MNKKSLIITVTLLITLGFLFPGRTNAATVTLDPVGPGSETSFDWNFYCKQVLGDGVQNWQCALLNDGCGTCIGSNQSGVYVRDLYEASNLAPGGVINKVTVYVIPGIYTTGGYKASIRTHDTTYDSPEVLNPGSGGFNYEWAQNPFTGSSWTWDEIIDLQIGASLKWISSTPSITQVYAVVDYDSSACKSHNIWGWAWSDNIGEISFSCENETEIGTGADYGVDIEEETGNFSGYAWSDSVGWIDFSPVGPYPETPSHSAKVNLQTGDISGWARVLNPGDTWDGWIKLVGK